MKMLAEGAVTVGDHKCNVGLPVTWMPLPLKCLAILMGKTASGMNHAVVGQIQEDAFLPIWNPREDGGGLVSVESLGFLVPVDPALIMNLGRQLERIEALASQEFLTKHLMLSIRSVAREALGRSPTSDVVLFHPNGGRLES